MISPQNFVKQLLEAPVVNAYYPHDDAQTYDKPVRRVLRKAGAQDWGTGTDLQSGERDQGGWVTKRKAPGVIRDLKNLGKGDKNFRTSSYLCRWHGDVGAKVPR